MSSDDLKYLSARYIAHTRESTQGEENDCGSPHTTDADDVRPFGGLHPVRFSGELHLRRYVVALGHDPPGTATRKRTVQGGFATQCWE